MNKKAPEARTLELARGYRRSFETRFSSYSEQEKRSVAILIVECASKLSKAIGRMPDNIIFGREIFTRDEVNRLITRLAELQDQAQERGFDSGIAAVIALKAVAELLLLSHMDMPPTIKVQRTREVAEMGAHMERIIDLYQGRGK